jgi:hypothetical protein
MPEESLMPTTKVAPVQVAAADHIGSDMLDGSSDPIRLLFPGLDRGTAIELPAGVSAGPIEGTETTAPPSTLTLTAFARTSGETAGADPKVATPESGGAQPSLPSVLPGLDGGPVFDVPGGTTADDGSLRGTNERPSAAHEIEATPPQASGDLRGQRIETIEAKDSVPEGTAQSVAEAETDIGAAFNAAATQSERPTSVTVGGRVFTREEVMAQITISADGLSSSWTIPQPTATVEPPLTEKRVRQLIREGINEWDSGFGVRYRSRHYIPRRRG